MMFIPVLKEDGSGEKEHISISQIHSLNEEPVLRTKIGSEHSYPILATDLVSDNKIYAVTISMIDGTERRIFEAGCRYDARSYISEFIDKFCVPTLGVEDYGRFENLITQSIKAITQKNPDGATHNDIVEHIKDKYYDNVCIAYLAHAIREMSIHDREEKLYFNGDHWNPNTRFRYGKEY